MKSDPLRSLEEWVISIDSGAETNLIPSIIAKEQRYPNHPERVVTKAYGSRPIANTGTVVAELQVQDSRGNWKIFRILAVTTPEAENITLGMPWLCHYNIKTNFARREIYFEGKQETPANIQLVSADEIWEDAAFVCLVTVKSPQESDGEIPPEYADFADVFSEEKAAELPPHREGVDLKVELITGGEPPFGPIYPLSPTELAELRQYLKTNLAKGFIRPSKSPAGSPILFAKKKGGELRLCVDYRALNRITVRNRYPLPLLDETIERLAGAVVFTQLDVRDAYYRIRIARGDEWKTAFRTRYGLYEYVVMPFGLTNAPATFQAYINKTLMGFLDVFVVVYLDDIVVYSRDETKHVEQVRQVLANLREAGLYLKLSKCFFHVREINFLGFMISSEGVSMEVSRVETILSWPKPTNRVEIQAFLGFVNFYRRFIIFFAKLAVGLTDMLRKPKISKEDDEKSISLAKGDFLTIAGEKSFCELRDAFANAVLLYHWNPEYRSRLETDSSGYALCGVMSQFHPMKGWILVAFYSRKMSKHERNYGIHDMELLAIVESFREWRHFLEGSQEPIEVISDHDSLRYFDTNQNLSRRQVRWAQELSSYCFVISYREGKKNPADGPSRRADYKRAAVSEDQAVLGEYYPAKLRKLLGRPSQIGPDHPEGTTGSRKQQSTGIPNQLLLDEPDHHKGTTGSRSWMKLFDQSLLKGPGHPEGDTGSQGWKKQGWISDSPCESDDKVAYLSSRAEALLHAVLAKGTASLEDSMLSSDLACEASSQEDPYRKDPSGELVERLPGLLAKDTLAIDIYEMLNGKRLPRDKGEQKRWSSRGRVLYYNQKLYVPEDPSLRIILIAKHHDDPLAGHFATRRTKELLQRKFYWPGMSQFIDDYCKACGVCRGSRMIRGKAQGLLQPLEIPAKPWEQISMDFITELPASTSNENLREAYDCILVIVDRFSKMAHFIPTRKTLKAEQLATIFIREVVRLHGVPANIVTDRGSVFAGDFWSDLMFLLIVRRALSTAYHPQTDGQTERLNSVLEQYLRAYINLSQDDWVDYLPLAEFAYNNSQQASTGHTPFFICAGIHPRTITLEVPGADNDIDIVAETLADRLASIRDQVRINIQHAQEYQQSYYNKKRVAKTFKPGDQVWVNARNIKTLRPSKKLDQISYGPYRILERIGSQAYRILLPTGLRIHDVFHVSLLHEHRVMEGVDSQARFPLRDVEQGDDREYRVYRIIDQREENSELQYRVHWVGYPREEATWEPATNLRHLRKKIREYQGRQKK